MVLKVENLCRRFNGDKVLVDVTFAVARAQLVSIIGPSGAGKTTLLKIIAGLESSDSGLVEKREITRTILVFQDYVLFPTMTVFDNVAFGLRARHEPKKMIEEKVNRILGDFGLEGSRTRIRRKSRPAKSSGLQSRARLCSTRLFFCSMNRSQISIKISKPKWPILSVPYRRNTRSPRSL